ncbi:M23 family metallopeptidase [Longispora sp. NPDC051575]|uniref:M23 family metallopeptidase n=1 Tax=Longispora sp. NPDC051575 TaxID=3154943 RepID=UPI00341353F9
MSDLACRVLIGAALAGLIVAAGPVSAGPDPAPQSGAPGTRAPEPARPEPAPVGTVPPPALPSPPAPPAPPVPPAPPMPPAPPSPPGPSGSGQGTGQPGTGTPAPTSADPTGSADPLAALPALPRSEVTRAALAPAAIREPGVSPAAAARGQAVLRAAQAYREVAEQNARLAAAEAALARDTETMRTDAGLPAELYRRAAAVPEPMRGPWWELHRANIRLPADRTTHERAVAADRAAVSGARGTADRAGRRARVVATGLDGPARTALETGSRAAPPPPGRLLSPVAGPVTSGFGTRMDPYFQRVAPHAGVDLAAPVGTPVLAAAPGRVLRAGWADGYGYYTCLDHPDRAIWTCYAHQSVILVRPGEQVSAGQPIGLAGSTGASTGPHVHFEVRRGGSPVDPRPWLAQ